MSFKYVFLAAALMISPAWAINKCIGADGKVSYQEQPCAGQGNELKIRPQGNPAPVTERKAPAAVAAPVSAPAATSVAVPAAPASTKSELELQAEACLNYYRPLLKDPAGAYFTAPSKEKGELTLRIHAKNSYGGVVSKAAKCEFKNDELDADWTKIHAQRGGW